MTAKMGRGYIVGLCSVVAVIGLSGCNGNQVTPDNSLPVLANFDFLELGMSYDEVVDKVGEADRDIGSGIFLMVYQLDDGTELILSFPSLDNLTAVHLYNPETDDCQRILGY